MRKEKKDVGKINIRHNQDEREREVLGVTQAGVENRGNPKLLFV